MRRCPHVGSAQSSRRVKPPEHAEPKADADDATLIEPVELGPQHPKDAVEDTAVVHPWYAARLVGQHRPDGGPFMVGECIAHDSKLPVLKLESRGYRSMS